PFRGGQFLKTIIILSILFVGSILYRRYFPVLGMCCKKLGELDRSTIVIDVRDYNESYKDPIPGAINIPIAYINRHYNEITNGDLHVVASNRLGKNFGIRLLRKKGFRVVGYSITNNNNIILKENQISLRTFC